MNADNKQQCHLTLRKLLMGQIHQIKAINHYFSELRSAIAENKLDELNQLLDENKATNNEIQELEDARNRVLTQYGFENNVAGFEKCIALCDQNNEIARHYQLFINELQELQKSIQVGRLLVVKGQEQTRRALQMLIGSGRATSMTYESNGTADHSADQRHLAQA